MSEYGGLCINGPFDGKPMSMDVDYFEAKWMHIPHRAREGDCAIAVEVKGFYAFDKDRKVWLWHGPHKPEWA